VPSLDLRFADNKSLVDAVTGASLVTFTRASSGTFVDSAGVLQTAVTNLLLRSEEFDTTWFGTRLSAFGSGSIANAIAAPNGTITADKIAEDTTASNTHFIAQTAVVTAGIPYAFSVYVKAAERTWAYVLTGGTPFGANGVYINLSNGSLGSTVGTLDSGPFVQAVGDGWYRVSFTATPSTGGNGQLQVRLATGNNAQTYTGDGTSGIYLWGAQLEQSSSVGEYIPTTSTINSAPRFDHNPTTLESLGLLVEEQRTNLLVQSEDFSTTWSLQTATVTTNATNSPAGTTTADKLITNNAQVIGAANQDLVKAASAITYTISVFAKASEHSALRLLLRDLLLSANRADVVFSLSTKTFSFPFVGGTYSGHSYSFVEYPNGWIRVFMTATTGSEIALRAQVINNTTGDGTSGLFVWGAQVEQGSGPPTSYIPTTTAAVTRSADVASISNANLLPWFTSSLTDHTFYVEARSGGTTANATLLEGYEGASLKGLSISLPSRPRMIQRHGASRFDTAAQAADIGLGNRARIAVVTSSDSSSALNGSAVSTGAAPAQVDWTVGSGLSIGSRAAGASLLFTGTIQRLTYWPLPLASSTLQALSQ
jgi:hypothetical protein